MPYKKYPGVAQLVARLLWEQDAAGSNPVTRTIMNESRFSNIFIEKRDLSYAGSLVIWGFPLFRIRALIFQNALNAKLIFLRKAAI